VNRLFRSHAGWILPMSVGVLFASFAAIGCARQDRRHHDESAATPAVAQYIGTNACADCHGDVAASFAQTGHPRWTARRRVTTGRT
jgi:mono/diheme cytochrome c family protein